MNEFLRSELLSSVLQFYWLLFIVYHLYILVLWYFKRKLYLTLWKYNKSAFPFFMSTIITFTFTGIFLLPGNDPEMQSNGLAIANTIRLLFIFIWSFVGLSKYLCKLRNKIEGAF